MKDVIQNFGLYDINLVSIDLLKMQDGEEFFYTPVVTFLIQDTTKDQQTHDRGFSAISEYWSTDPNDCALRAATAMGKLFYVSKTITIIDYQSGKFIKTFELESPKQVDEQSKYIPINTTLQ